MEERYEPKDDVRELARAINSLKNEKEVVAFLRDLLTIGEINEFSRRFQIMKSLVQKIPYQKIALKFNTSTATVTRVAHWIKFGTGGYRMVIKRLFGGKTAS
jgi:TrpR-related protein YerC/YecD